ncbi:MULTISPECIES: IclR family transcriptional regulator [unclassified Bradyrhizobium]|uniref:IclR family transcriptional regulator n=1 Tax=unclassified Bradyrhizobium TaxID=2631580 RepID=UPI002916DF60|nr:MULTISPECIES: IclR family transcriptional regulator [unclassified Bradyrhizobium]
MSALDSGDSARSNIRTIVRNPNHSKSKCPLSTRASNRKRRSSLVDEDSKAGKSVVQSLAKGFQVLNAFTSEEPELVLADVARRAALDKGTTFRLLNTLVMLGYVEKVGDSRRFRLTLKCLDLGFNAIARSELRTQARPILRSLVGEMNEAASLAVLDGSDIVYVERIQAGLVRLGVDVRIGSRAPVYSTAVGQAILSLLPVETQIEVLEAQPRIKRTETTITDLDALLQRLCEVKAAGYALSNQENAPGLCVLAAPVIDRDGIPLAAISIAAPTMRITADDFERLGVAPLLRAAAQLSRALEAMGGATATVAKR